MKTKMNLKQAVEINLNYIKHVARLTGWMLLFMTSLMVIKVVFILSAAAGMRWLNWVWSLLIILVAILVAINKRSIPFKEQQSRWSVAATRGLDIFLSCLGILISAPLFLLIGIAIKINSPGPVFCRQKRVGKGGKTFQAIRFRTHRLYGDAKNDIRLTAQEDVRLTRMGIFLIRTKLKELPQLFDILKGNATFFGSR